VATAPFKGHAGFRVNKLASPWEPLSVLAEKWERIQASGNPEQLKTFYNTQLAETFKEKHESPPWQDLAERKEGYDRNAPPDGVVFLTAGVDIQKNRIEVEIVGWGRGKRSWSIDYRVIEGFTAGPEAWEKLAQLLTETWTTDTGAKLTIRLMGIDSGYNTARVYDFCRQHGSRRVAPLKGMDGQSAIISAPRPIDRRRDSRKFQFGGLKLITVGVGVVKDEVYGSLVLKLNEDGSTPDGYCHFPDYDESYFQGLTSETKSTVLVRGYPREIWQKAPGSRNEPLDCRVYARAAAAIVGIDRMQPADWDALAGEVDPEQRAQSRPEQPKRRKSSFWGN
jgi:phage terminase large subunit GpA-like protein